MKRTIAGVGKKLGWENIKGIGVDMRCYDACRFESLGRLASATMTAGTTLNSGRKEL
jgi:hypothetical protein